VSRAAPLRTPYLNLGDPGILYRHTLWQVDSPGATARAPLLAGFVLPTDDDRDVRIRAGFVATVARRWFELDADWLWIEGTGDAGDSARYDLSWQMCLPPFSNDLNTTHNANLMLGGRLRF